jgi:predicted transcriptional regulator
MKDSLNELMSKAVRTLNAGKSLRDALELMVRYDIGSVVIVDDSGRGVRIVTESDIVKRLTSKSPIDLKTPLSD